MQPRAVAADMGMAGTESVAEVAQEEKVGVLLLNLGGPETLADVRPFLYNLFADPDIIRLPPAVAWLQRPIALLISSLRAPKVRVCLLRTRMHLLCMDTLSRPLVVTRGASPQLRGF